MSDISLIETALIDEKIQKVIRQTDYNEDTAREKLSEHGFDEVETIKAYLGIKKKEVQVIKSVNQEIYKQLRYKLNSSINDYNIRVEKNSVKKNI